MICHWLNYNNRFLLYVAFFLLMYINIRIAIIFYSINIVRVLRFHTNGVSNNLLITMYGSIRTLHRHRDHASYRWTIEKSSLEFWQVFNEDLTAIFYQDWEIDILSRPGHIFYQDWGIYILSRLGQIFYKDWDTVSISEDLGIAVAATDLSHCSPYLDKYLAMYYSIG